MTHYVCGGNCNGVSDDANAVCQDENCSNIGQSFTDCECDEPAHSKERGEDGEESSNYVQEM